MSDLDKINSIFNAKIDAVKTKEELQNIKTEFFGKNGQITAQFKNLSSINPDKRKEFASSLNKIKDDLSNQLDKKILEIETKEINERIRLMDKARENKNYVESDRIRKELFDNNIEIENKGGKTTWKLK